MIPILLHLLCMAAPADAVVARALEAHPALEVPAARAAEARARARAARSWPDPVLSLEASNLPVDALTLSDHPMSGIQLGLRQALPVVGRLEASARVADAEVPALEAEARVHAPARVAARVRAAWWELVRAEAQARVTRSHLGQLDQLEAAVSARYRVGSGGQGALLAVGLRRARLEQSLADLERDAAAARGALQAAMGVAPGPLTFPDPLPVRPPPADPEAWLQRAREGSAEAHRRDAGLARAEALTALARTHTRPEPSAWLGYRLRTIRTPTDAGTDFVGAGVAIPVPTGSLSRRRADLDAATALATGARAEHAAWLRTAEARLRALHATWTRAAERARITADRLLPDARRVLEATLADYRVGRADFARLVDAEEAVLDLQREAIEAAATTGRAAAAVEDLLALPLEETP
jgi:outer membrane protein, heavy metal efflux system